VGVWVEVWGNAMLCNGSFTFKIATAVYNTTLKQLQHVMWLKPKCKKYTCRMRITSSVFEHREIKILVKVKDLVMKIKNGQKV
jgi:hypothetical protein